MSESKQKKLIWNRLTKLLDVIPLEKPPLRIERELRSYAEKLSVKKEVTK